jgi:hypothetical protein
MSNTLFVRNLEQAAAWLELDGQLSDGFWESARPYDHWKRWCNAKVVVAEADQPVGRTFPVLKNNYNFAAKALLDVVGLRMLGIVRIARAHGLMAADALEHAVSCEDGLLEDSKYTQAKLDAAGITYEQAMRALFDKSYTMSDLRSDLNDLKAIIKVRL